MLLAWTGKTFSNTNVFCFKCQAWRIVNVLLYLHFIHVYFFTFLVWVIACLMPYLKDESLESNKSTFGMSQDQGVQREGRTVSYWYDLRKFRFSSCHKTLSLGATELISMKRRVEGAAWYLGSLTDSSVFLCFAYTYPCDTEEEVTEVSNFDLLCTSTVLSKLQSI